MLCEITIENVAVIEKATAEFSQGLTVLTGETGAGKSIMIDSINAILGNRASRDLVRSGAQKAKIWASFANPPKKVLAQLAEAGYDAEDELLIYREISADGKSSCRLNGAPATTALLREVCEGLVTIHGQHDNQNLLNQAKHIDILDSFAKNEVQLEEYAREYEALLAIRREMDALSLDEGEKSRKLELLRYEVDEIDAAKLEAGEEELLVERRTVVQNARDILEALSAAYLRLTGGDDDTGAATLLSGAAADLTAAARYDGELGRFAEVLNEAYYTVTEAASDIQNRLQDYEFGDESLDEIELRLDLIYRLKQKYGPSIEAVLAFGNNARAELEAIEFSGERLARLAAQEAAKLADAEALADALTNSRLAAFDALNGEITGALAFLNMPGIHMALQHRKTELGPKGRDEVAFFISTNPGEEPKALSKIASGGELARIMLAIKSALADRDELPTVIYDEIDTGISGLAAGRIGKLLRDTAKGRQVICVTHTAQIAAYADAHLKIEKRVEGGRTYTDILPLDDENRVDELARIVSGDAITEVARANAREMLENGQKG